MDIDLSPFPTLLALKPLLTEAGYAIRSKLSRDQLQECEQLVKDTKKLADDIESARTSGDDTLYLLVKILNGDRLRELSDKLKAQCIESTPQATLKPAPKSKSVSAFWATTPFQIMGVTQQLGRDMENAAQSPLVAPILGAASFVGLTIAAGYRLAAFRDTSLLPRLIPAL